MVQSALYNFTQIISDYTIWYTLNI